MRLDTTPNVDYFTRDEIKKIVKSFKEAVSQGQLNEVSKCCDTLQTY